MARSNIRVLALDLDGTLTNDEKIVTPRTRAALDAAAAQGVTIVLASGRPTAGILPLAKELGLDKKGGCVLAYNGGLRDRRGPVSGAAGSGVRPGALRICSPAGCGHPDL